MRLHQPAGGGGGERERERRKRKRRGFNHLQEMNGGEGRER